MKWKEGVRGLISVEDCITTERRGLYDYMKENKEDMLSGAKLMEEGETKQEFTKIKIYENKKTVHEEKLQEQFVEKTRIIAHEFSGKSIRNVFFKERDRGHVICSSGAGTKNQCNRCKNR